MDTGNALLYDAAMRTIPRRVAAQIIYWNVVLAVLIVCLAAIAFLHRIHRFDTLIVQQAAAHQLDPRLVSALIWQESRFRPERVGTKQEVGLMQITEGAVKEWAKANRVPIPARQELFDPELNIRAGTWYLARAVKRWSIYSDPLPYALAEYNAGRSNAQRWAAAAGGDSGKFVDAITYPTTRKYVRNILKRYRGKV